MPLNLRGWAAWPLTDGGADATVDQVQKERQRPSNHTIFDPLGNFVYFAGSTLAFGDYDIFLQGAQPRRGTRANVAHEGEEGRRRSS